MDQETLWREFSALPAEARRQVESLIASLAARYGGLARQPRPEKDASGDSFIGMWRDREDMADSTAWVRTLRADEWSRHRG